MKTLPRSKNPLAAPRKQMAGWLGIVPLPAAIFIGLIAQCQGQGTMTYTFEGAPRGTQVQYGVYVEQGMQFGMNYGPGSVYLNGGGIPGFPDNGTGYMDIPDGIPGGNGDTRFEFGFDSFYPTNSSQFSFNLLSFDAAEYDGAGPQTLTVVGYHAQIMGPTILVTNIFSVNSQTFQTFYLDSSFNDVYQVDVFNARWSLDNLVIGGVPEPSSGTLLLLGAVSLAGFRQIWCKRGKPKT